MSLSTDQIQNQVVAEHFDVIVIGSGFAGLAAAIEAMRAGASVCVLEKMKAAGGNSIISDGGIAVPASREQAEQHIEDSKELFYEDMMRAGLFFNRPALVRTLADNANDAFEWTKSYLGVPYLDKIEIFGGHSVARCFTAKGITGGTIIKQMLEKVKELKIPIRYQHKFLEFLREENGNIVGMRILRGYDYLHPEAGEKVRLYANRGIVLATGGFGADVAFRQAQDPRLDENLDTTNKPFATAEALQEVLRIGAQPVDLSKVQLGPWASPNERGYGVGPYFSEYVVFQYGIVVDPDTGKRFCNELADRKTLSDALLSIGHPCVGIADQACVERSGWSIEKCLKKGVVKSFDSIESLAEEYSIPIDSLKHTIELFNQDIQTGKDSLFDKPILEDAPKIQNPPFFAMRLWPKVHFTMGGVGINERAEVLDRDGRPIPHLFAAGEVTGGVHGASRLGSCSITDCLVFGKIAGKNAAVIGSCTKS
ncbi:MAG: flavocytochrome c [Clostridiales bacterium]|nr:flavocytochrome c [Clostridiales bacterium]